MTNTSNSLNKIIGTLLPVTDLNSATITGVYKYDGFTKNKPAAAYYGVCAVFSTNATDVGNSWYYQLAFTTNSDTKIYYRQKVNTNAWTTWTALTPA